jgi:hypothetical protein
MLPHCRSVADGKHSFIYSFMDHLTTLKMAVFWVFVHLPNDGGASTSETSVNFYRLHGATTQKTAIFILAAMRT